MAGYDQAMAGVRKMHEDAIAAEREHLETLEGQEGTLTEQLAACREHQATSRARLMAHEAVMAALLPILPPREREAATTAFDAVTAAAAMGERLRGEG